MLPTMSPALYKVMVKVSCCGPLLFATRKILPAGCDSGEVRQVDLAIDIGVVCSGDNGKANGQHSYDDKRFF